jgi:hypothetical protein
LTAYADEDAYREATTQARITNKAKQREEYERLVAEQN